MLSALIVLSCVFSVFCDYDSTYACWGDKKPDYLLGNFEIDRKARACTDPKNNKPAFVQVKTHDYVNWIRREVWDAWQKMFTDNDRDPKSVLIISGHRSFKYQRSQIWNDRMTKCTKGKSADACIKILTRQVAMPGTSRHHWGTELDVFSRVLENYDFKSGTGLELYNFLRENGPKYGFFQPYETYRSPGQGYDEERWHWSYFPLSKKMREDFMVFFMWNPTTRYWYNNVTKVLGGFNGVEAGSGYYMRFVKNINPQIEMLGPSAIRGARAVSPLTESITTKSSDPTEEQLSPMAISFIVVGVVIIVVSVIVILGLTIYLKNRTHVLLEEDP